MIRTKKAPKPTLDQSKWLRRIAQAPMIKTYAEGHQATYSLTTGEAVPLKIAAALIGNGWVKGQRDGMFDDPQSYVVLKPDLSDYKVLGERMATNTGSPTIQIDFRNSGCCRDNRAS